MESLLSLFPALVYRANNVAGDRSNHDFQSRLNVRQGEV